MGSGGRLTGWSAGSEVSFRKRRKTENRPPVLLDKTENVKFYTEKCGFHIVSTEKEGDVLLARFVLERQSSLPAERRI